MQSHVWVRDTSYRSSPAFAGLGRPAVSQRDTDGNVPMADVTDPPTKLVEENQESCSLINQGSNPHAAHDTEILSLYEETNFPELNMWASMARQTSMASQPLHVHRAPELLVCPLGKRKPQGQFEGEPEEKKQYGVQRALEQWA